MSFDGNSRDFLNIRLDTWKAIAQHLGRSSRTAQRWHAEYGLPVHHLGGDASSVFAYTDELERWLRQRTGKTQESRVRPGQVQNSVQAISFVGKRFQAPEPGEIETTPGDERVAADLVFRAQKLWESLSASNLSAIARIYRKAVDLDAYNARAFAGLGQALIAQSVLGNLHPSAALPPAEAALERALEIDPGLFEAECGSALIKILRSRDWSCARRLLDSALLRRPQSSQALVGRALLAIAQGSLVEASHCLRSASLSHPLNSSVAELLCWVEYLSGRLESTLDLISEARETGHSGAILDTVEALTNILVTGPLAQVEQLEFLATSSTRNYSLLGVLGLAYGQIGHLDAAREVLESMTRPGLAGTFDFAYPIALTFIGIGKRSEALEWLKTSYFHGSLWSLGFRSDPILAGLRENVGFYEVFGPTHYPIPAQSAENRELEKPPMPYSA